jgi:hypothetical protein
MPDLEPTGTALHLHAVGSLHIKTFPETGSEIRGNVSARLDDEREVAGLLNARADRPNVWGYRRTVDLADRLRRVDA